jgi:hypothetical protein
MCFSHWRLVPTEIRQAVLATYRPGQGDADPPSLAWCHAADRAIETVALKEKRKVTEPLAGRFHPGARQRTREVSASERTRAVNMRDEAYDVYIGRPREGLEGPFGNPFRAGPALKRFREYFLDRVERDTDFRTQVLALRGKRLGCYCKPKPCHGDIIAEWIDSQPVAPRDD